MDTHRTSRWRRLGADQTGQATVEWTLLLAAFGLPMIYVFAMLLAMTAEHFRFVSFFQTLPFS